MRLMKFLTLLAVALAIAFVPLATFAGNGQATDADHRFGKVAPFMAVPSNPQLDLLHDGQIITINADMSNRVVASATPLGLQEAITTTPKKPFDPSTIACSHYGYFSPHFMIAATDSASRTRPYENSEVSMMLKMPYVPAIEAGPLLA